MSKLKVSHFDQVECINCMVNLKFAELVKNTNDSKPLLIDASIHPEFEGVNITPLIPCSDYESPKTAYEADIDGGLDRDFNREEDFAFSGHVLGLSTGGKIIDQVLHQIYQSIYYMKDKLITIALASDNETYLREAYRSFVQDNEINICPDNNIKDMSQYLSPWYSDRPKLKPLSLDQFPFFYEQITGTTKVLLCQFSSDEDQDRWANFNLFELVD